VVREYTTTVEIGGKRVEAFGDACLQADGSWRMGPVKGTAQ
jgi:surface antigen